MKSKIDKKISELITDYMIAVANDRLELTEEEILNEEDEGMQEILFGLRHLADDLEYNKGKIVELTEVQKNQLEQIRQKNKELERFSYALSHDLKSPLRAINNLLTFAKDDLEDEGIEMPDEVKDYFKKIKERVYGMEDLIHSVLEYTHSQKEKEKEEINLNSLFTEILDLVDVPSNFKIEVNTSLPSITFNNVELKQVLQNLITNAIKYNQSENPEIHVFGEDIEGYFCLHVKDNGIGIPEAFHGKIFDLFETLKTTKSKQSTGLGLPIVKKVLMDNDCKIKVDSVVGEGSDFMVYFPIGIKKP